MIAVATVLALVAGGMVAMTQVSNAAERGSRAKCGPTVDGAQSPDGRSTTATRQNGRVVRQHWGDGQEKPEGCEPESARSNTRKSKAGSSQQVVCPSVEDQLPEVPGQAQDQVDRILQQMEAQTAEANNRLAAARGQGGQDFVNNSILRPLKDQRVGMINSISGAIGQEVADENEIDGLATCSVSRKGDQDNQDGDQNNGDQNNGEEQGEEQPAEEEPAEEEEQDNADDDRIDADDIIAENCEEDSNLEPHDGFQNGNRCVDTEMGEVGNEDRNPSLLITDFPEEVGVDEPFQIRVSTRNLIRDRFLAAGQGGYYVEMSKLNEAGLVRGHFHTACRVLNNEDEAPDPQPAPAFFVATEDGGGGAQADEIVIEVPGLPEQGTFQCASWAGDGSHRLPMMQRANQTPAFDAVRVRVE